MTISTERRRAFLELEFEVKWSPRQSEPGQLTRIAEIQAVPKVFPSRKRKKTAPKRWSSVRGGTGLVWLWSVTLLLVETKFLEMCGRKETCCSQCHPLLLFWLLPYSRKHKGMKASKTLTNADAKGFGDFSTCRTISSIMLQEKEQIHNTSKKKNNYHFRLQRMYRWDGAKIDS